MSIVKERGAALDRSVIQKTGYPLAIAATVAGFAALYVSDPLMAVADIALAAASVAITLQAPELFEIRNRGGRRNYNPLFLVPAGLVFAAGVRNQFGDATPLLIAALIGGAAGGGLAATRMGRPGLGGPWVFVILLALIGGALGYGAPAMIDVRFDTSEAQPIHSPISSMYASRGRSTTYHLRLPPWGPRTQPNTVTVSGSLYDRLNPGDPVCIDLHPGLLQISWFVVQACPAPQ
jgi:hypothetical protein